VDDERDLIARLKFETDKDSAKDAQAAVKNLDKKTQDLAKSAEQASKRFNQMRETAERIKQVGATIAMTGAAILGPLTLAGKAYLDNAKALEEAAKNGQQLTAAQQEAVKTAQEWQAATQRIGDATSRIGGVVIREVLPLLETAADLATRAADFAEKNPESIKAALMVGGALVTVGALSSTVGTLLHTYSTVAGLLAQAGPIGAAMTGLSTALTGAIAPLIAVVVPLTALVGAVIALKALLESEFGQQGVTAGAQVAAMGAYGIGYLSGGVEQANLNFIEASKSLGLLNQETYESARASVDAAMKSRTEYQQKVALANQSVSVWQQIGQTMTGFWQSILNVFQTLPSIPGRASGGYVNDGLYQLHNNEFVLNAATTKAVERIAQSRLDQQTVLQLLTQSGGRGTIQQNYQFYGGFSESERAWFKQTARREAETAIVDLMGAA